MTPNILQVSLFKPQIPKYSGKKLQSLRVFLEHISGTAQSRQISDLDFDLINMTCELMLEQEMHLATKKFIENLGDRSKTEEIKNSITQNIKGNISKARLAEIFMAIRRHSRDFDQELGDFPIEITFAYVKFRSYFSEKL